MNHPQRLPYIDPACITDPAMMAEFQRAAREGAPRPESHAIRANVPDVFWAFGVLSAAIAALGVDVASAALFV